MPDTVTKTADPSTADKAKAAAKAAEETEETDLEGSDEDEDEDSEEVPKGPLHKSKRWQKVHGDLKEFKTLGLTPAALQTHLARLAKFDQIVAEEEAAARAKKSDDDEGEDEDTKKRRKAGRKELSKIAPEIDDIKRTAERTDIFFQSIERRATREMTKLLKDSGMSTKEKSLEAMSDVLSGIIAEDEALYDEYLGSPQSAVQEAFKRFRADSVDAATRAAKANLQKDKAKLLGLPKTHKAGGTSEVAVNRTEGPKNLKEARQAAERRLAALEE